jgi:hypothetical protein
VDELKASLQSEQVTRIEGVIPAKAVSAVQVLPGVRQATRAEVDGGNELVVVTEPGFAGLPTLVETLTAAQARIQKIAPEEITLEDVFIAKTGRTLAEDTREGE